MPPALLEPLLPRSTIENTEEEYNATIELCLSSQSLSSTKRRNNSLPCDCTHESSDERPLKRICTIGIACKHLEELSAIETTAFKSKDENESNSIRLRKRTSRELRSSVSYAEYRVFSHTNMSPDILTGPALAKLGLRRSKARGINNMLL